MMLAQISMSNALAPEDVAKDHGKPLLLQDLSQTQSCCTLTQGIGLRFNWCKGKVLSLHTFA